MLDTFRIHSLGLVMVSAAVLLLAPPASAHICLFHPLQRGEFVLDNPGDPSCFRNQGPCGHAPDAVQQVIGTAGAAYTVQFQQALNHFNVSKPGVMRVQIALTGGSSPTEADFAAGMQFGQVIPDFNAMDMMTLTNLSVTATLPKQACDHCVLRVTYQSNNNEEPEMFYQCSDIAILAPSGPEATLERTGCTTVAQWEVQQTVSTSSAEPSGHGSLSYDAIGQQIFSQIIDKDADMIEQRYINYTAATEWRVRRQLSNPSHYTCYAQGLDTWSDWSYGAAANEFNHTTEWVKPDGEPAFMVDIYSNHAADYSWTVRMGADAKECVPIARERPVQGDSIEYSDYTEGIKDFSVFTVPARCQPASLAQRCGHGKPSNTPIHAHSADGKNSHEAPPSSGTSAGAKKATPRSHVHRRTHKRK